MKKINKYTTTALLLFIAVTAMGAKITDNDLKLGDATPANNKQIQMGNGRLLWNGSSSKLTFSNDSGTSFKDIGSGAGGGSGLNLIADSNFDFESGNPPASWTASGGTFIANTATPGFGAQSGSWDASAASQTLSSVLKAVPLGLEGRNCGASMQYKWVNGTAGHLKLQVVDGSATLISEANLEPGSDWKKLNLNFICPVSASVRVRLSSTADAALVLIDNASVGEPDNLFQVAQAKFVGKVTYPGNTTNCAWTIDSATFVDFPADTDCATASATGSLLAPATKIPGFQMQVVAGKKYQIVLNGVAQTTANLGVMRFSDGTDFSDQVHANLAFADGSKVFIYEPTTSGLKTIILQGRDTGAGSFSLFNYVGSDVLGDTSFSVYEYPAQAELALSASAKPYFVSTPQTITASGLITMAHGLNSAPTFVELYLVNQTTELGYSPGDTILVNRTISNSGLDTFWGTMYVDATNINIRFGNGAANFNAVNKTTGAPADLTNANWKLVVVATGTYTISTPILVGNVVSGAGSSLKIEYAKISAAGVVSGESSDWINGNASLSDTSLYDLTLNSGVFSSAPVCFGNTSDTSNFGSYLNINPTSSVAVSARTGNHLVGTSQQKIADDFSITCLGPK